MNQWHLVVDKNGDAKFPKNYESVHLSLRYENGNREMVIGYYDPDDKIFIITDGFDLPEYIEAWHPYPDQRLILTEPLPRITDSYEEDIYNFERRCAKIIVEFKWLYKKSLNNELDSAGKARMNKLARKLRKKAPEAHPVVLLAELQVLRDFVAHGLLMK